MDELIMLVSEMKIKDKQDKNKIIEKIRLQETLTGKCIIARKYLKPQSTDMETICKDDLKIGKSLNINCGDGRKNAVNYEIKISIHAKKSKINFVQIRPDHDVDYYIFITYNMYKNESIGKGYIFKIPSKIVNELVVKYGCYAHGSRTILGKIATNNIKGRNCEYALRCDPNAKKGKNVKLWNEFLKYEVEYNSEYF